MKIPTRRSDGQEKRKEAARYVMIPTKISVVREKEKAHTEKREFVHGVSGRSKRA